MDFMARYSVLTLPLLLLGCVSPLPQPAETIPSINESSPSKLRPGAFCRIEMRLPPSASYGSYQRYTGTISEVTDEEIVLAQATEESKVEYGSAHRRPPSSQAREAIRVPIAGIGAIQVSAASPATPPPAASTAQPQPAPP